MKLSSLILFLAMAASWLPSSGAEPEPVAKVISLKGLANGKVSIEGLAGTYQVDEEFPGNSHIRITGREVYVSRVIISMSADSTLCVSVALPSWLKVPSRSELQVSITGPKLTSLSVSKGSDIAVQGFYSTPRSLTLNVKGRSHLLFNNPVKTSDIAVTVSGGSSLTVNAAQAGGMTMTLSENSQGYVGGGSIFDKLDIDATGGSKAFVTNSSVRSADFNAADMSQIVYNIMPSKFSVHVSRGGMIKQSNEIPKGLL